MALTETLDGQLTLPRIPYSVVRLPLDDARNNVLVVSNIEADFISVIDLTNPTAAPISMRLNYPNAAPIPMAAGLAMVTPPEFLKRRYDKAGIVTQPPVRRLYMSNGASPGGSITLAIGGDASFTLTSSGTVSVTGISTMISQLTTLIATTAAEVPRLISGVDLSALLASTNAPLTAGAMWTSGWFGLDRFVTIVITCVADRATRLWIQQSWDGSLVDAVETRDYPHPAGALSSGDGYYSGVVAPWGRLLAQNTSAVNQALLRIKVGGRAI